MTGHRALRISLVTTAMVGAGALLSAFAGHLMTLAGIPSVPRVWLLPDPLGWAFRPGTTPMLMLAMLLGLVVLCGLTLLFVRLIVRGALPGRGAAVFFGTWGAVMVAAWAAGLVRAPLMLVVFDLDPQQGDIYLTQFATVSTAGVSWGLAWGWLTAAVAALIHRAGGGAAPITAPLAGQTSFPAPYGYDAGQSPAYPPQPGPPTYPAYPAQHQPAQPSPTTPPVAPPWQG